MDEVHRVQLLSFRRLLAPAPCLHLSRLPIGFEFDLDERETVESFNDPIDRDGGLAAVIMANDLSLTVSLHAARRLECPNPAECPYNLFVWLFPFREIAVAT